MNSNVIDSIVLIDKPLGISSHTLVNKLRKIIGIRRIGHTGTLDPLANGLMVLCIGRATKLSEDFLTSTKEYIADIDFGYETDTLDSEGSILYRSNNSPSLLELKNTLLELSNITTQTPPIYSAIKVNGVRAYKIARKDMNFTLDKREIKILQYELIDFKDSRAKVKFKVSKGTYIRSLVRDLGILCNSRATMTGLRRTAIGDFKIEDAYTLEEIENMILKNEYSFLQGVERLYKNFKKIELNDFNNHRYENGASIHIEKESGKYRVYYKEEFIGLALVKDNILKVYKYRKI